MDIAVLGAGAFGSALAVLLQERGHRVTLWCRSEAAARELASSRESRYLPGVVLAPGIRVSHELAVAVATKPLVLAVVPSHAQREIMAQAAPHLAREAVVVNASKGIEEESLKRVDQIYRDVLPQPLADRAAYLSGPTFAKELAQGLPAAIVVASRATEAAALVQEELSTDRLRVYTSDDVVGIELGGALKNVCAIGAGIVDGLGYGLNTRAALITRGLAELSRLGARQGANPLTFMGLAGLGDLVLTCTGHLSRNRQVGVELGKGRSLAGILAGMKEVAEGVRTTRAAHDLARRLGVEMPITAAIHAVLYESKPPRDAVQELMRRDPRPERG